MANSEDVEKKIRFLDKKISQGEILLKKLLYLTIADVILIIAGIIMAIFLEEIFIIIGIAVAVIGAVIMILLLRNLNDLKKGINEYMQRRNALSSKM
jgi:hypothetical protein